MNFCKYKIDSEYLETIRLNEWLSIDNFRKRFSKENWKFIAYTTYFSVLKNWYCSWAVMNCIRGRYPEAIWVLPVKKNKGWKKKGL